MDNPVLKDTVAAWKGMSLEQGPTEQWSSLTPKERTDLKIQEEECRAAHGTSPSRALLGKAAHLTSNQTLSHLNNGTLTFPNCQQEMPTEGLPGTL